MDFITNMELIVNEARIRNNHLPAGEFQFNPCFGRQYGKAEDGRYFNTLYVDIADTDNTSFPVSIYASITGYFNLSDYSESVINNFLENQSAQLIFPYLRALVTSLTVGAMMPPIVLPVINAQEYFNNNAEA
jgi:preprotein translocase subunit SecB